MTTSAYGNVSQKLVLEAHHERFTMSKGSDTAIGIAALNYEHYLAHPATQLRYP